uniref:Uncharacterized protein n=1 Tax=Rhizophora mucronata TaxID=61149 RepID=A0A2P2NLF8_RHIMU
MYISGEATFFSTLLETLRANETPTVKQRRSKKMN